MIKIFKTFGGYIEIKELEKNCWINVVNPTPDEINKLSCDFELPIDLINDVLDQDERPRIEFEESWTFIILRIPIEVKNNGVPFNTIPLGVIIKENLTITVCAQENEVLPIGNLLI